MKNIDVNGEKTGFELEKIPKEWKIVGKWHDGKKVNKKLAKED